MARGGAVQHPRDLLRLPLIRFSPGQPGGWTMRLATQPDHTVIPLRALCFGSAFAIRNAAIAGKAMLPRLLGEPDIGAGRRIRLLPD